MTILRPARHAAFLLASASSMAQDDTTIAAGEERAGNVLFRRPDGWERKDDGDRVLLVPSGLADKERCEIAILPGETVDAAPPAAPSARSATRAGRVRRWKSRTNAERSSRPTVTDRPCTARSW